MAIDEFRKINLVLDRANDFIIDAQHVMQGDLQGRELVVQITNGGIVENQGDLVLNLGWYHTGIQNKGLDPFAPLDAERGIFSLKYNDKMLTPGKVIATIQIISLDAVINSRPFEIVVGKNPIDATAIVLGDSFAALTGALDKVEYWNNLLAEKVDNIELVYTEQLDQLTADLGNVSDLQTETKSSAISAINEIKNRIDTFSPAPEVINIGFKTALNVRNINTTITVEDNNASRYLRLSGDLQITMSGSDGSKERFSITGNQLKITDICVQGRFVYIGSEDKTLRKIDAKTGVEVWRVKENTEPIVRVLADNGDYVYTRDMTGTIIKFDAQTGDRIKNIAFDGILNDRIPLCAIDKNGNLYVGYGNNTIHYLQAKIMPNGSIGYEDKRLSGTSTHFFKNLGPIVANSDGSTYMYTFNGVIGGGSSVRTGLCRFRPNGNSYFAINADLREYKSMVSDSKEVYLYGYNVRTSGIDKTRPMPNDSADDFKVDRIWTVEFPYDLGSVLSIDQEDNLYFKSADGKSIMKMDTTTKEITEFYTFESEITALQTGELGTVYTGLSDLSFKKLTTGYDPFTTKFVQSRKLLDFDNVLNIPKPLLFTASGDYDVMSDYVNYQLEVRADGIYTRASSSFGIDGNWKIRFDTVLSI